MIAPSSEVRLPLVNMVEPTGLIFLRC
uniref:Uncharacterized protein n=1 Tax=Rhizophora mucronata TaxID=61149 RepID=A0A2P2PFE8_RHIMU